MPTTQGIELAKATAVQSFWNSFIAYMDPFAGLVYERPSTQKTDVYARLGSAPFPREWKGDRDYKPAKEYSHEVTNVPYEVSVRIDKELIKYQQWDEIGNLSANAGMKLRTTNLDFRFAREFTGTMPDSYQRLLLDAMNGDASLFARHDEVEVAWSIIDPILAAWQSPAAPPLETYPTGDWGPACSDEWMRAQGREWFDVCPVLH